MKDFETNFIFETTVQTHGRNEEGALENINRFLDEHFIQGAEHIMGCGIDFDRDNAEIKEIYNGWFELKLTWSGNWIFKKKTEEEAKETAAQILDERLTPFYQMLENLSVKNRRFAFISLDKWEVTDVLEY